MGTCHLRIFPYTDEEHIEQSQGQEATVSMRFGDLFPLLAEALSDDYAWLRDFEDDEIKVTPDLYDVIRAFADLRSPA